MAANPLLRTVSTTPSALEAVTKRWRGWAGANARDPSKVPDWRDLTPAQRALALRTMGGPVNDPGTVTASSRDVSSGLNYAGTRQPDGSLAIDARAGNPAYITRGAAAPSVRWVPGVANVIGGQTQQAPVAPTLETATAGAELLRAAPGATSATGTATGLTLQSNLDQSLGNPAFEPTPVAANPNTGMTSNQLAQNAKNDFLAKGGSEHRWNKGLVAQGVRSRIDGRATLSPRNTVTGSNDIQRKWGWGASGASSMDLPY